jgi:hypothetical protein
VISKLISLRLLRLRRI